MLNRALLEDTEEKQKTYFLAQIKVDQGKLRLEGKDYLL